jgi:putative oxidoreductase
MASSERDWPRTMKRIGLGILVTLEFLGMGLAGMAKFQGDAWQRMFTEWGYPVWFSFVIGGLEVTGAFLILVPRLTSYAAMLLIAVMLGALGTELFVMRQLGPTMPIIHLTILSILLAARWRHRWRRGSAWS